MAKLDCWDFKNCGRQKGGPHTSDMGECPASVVGKANGVNEGSNAGRVCWAVAGTLCNGQVQGTFAHKIGNCLKCDFYSAVKQEQGLIKFKMSY